MPTRLIIGAASVEPAEIERLRTLAEQCASRLPFAVEWRPTGVPGDIDLLLIDVDSIYGHVDWLRAHAEGRALIALTSKPDGAHDHELSRSADASELTALLLQFEELTSDYSPVPAADAKAAARSAALAPTRELPVLGDPAAATTSPERNSTAEAAAAQTADSGPAPVEPPPEPRSALLLIGWLTAVDGLHAPASIPIGDGHRLLVDPKRGLYSGPEALKPLEDISTRSISRSEWRPESDSAMDQAASAQPLARLRLIAGLKAHEGCLAPDFDAETLFQLPRWPQIEREFPRHLRLATALMKGPATVSELASQVGLPESEVADFINGFVAAGFVEPVASLPSETVGAPAASSGRLLGRIRSLGRKS